MIICEYVKSIMEKFSVVLFCVRLYNCDKICFEKNIER